MKHIRFLFFIVTLSMVFVSCSPRDPEAEFVGKWRSTGQPFINSETFIDVGPDLETESSATPFDAELVFLDDGTVTLNLGSQMLGPDTFYIPEDGIIEFTGMVSIFLGEENEYEFLNNDILILRYGDLLSATFEREKE